MPRLYIIFGKNNDDKLSDLSNNIMIGRVHQVSVGRSPEAQFNPCRTLAITHKRMNEFVMSDVQIASKGVFVAARPYCGIWFSQIKQRGILRIICFTIM